MLKLATRGGESKEPISPVLVVPSHGGSPWYCLLLSLTASFSFLFRKRTVKRDSVLGVEWIKLLLLVAEKGRQLI